MLKNPEYVFEISVYSPKHQYPYAKVRSENRTFVLNAAKLLDPTCDVKELASLGCYATANHNTFLYCVEAPGDYEETLDS